MFIAVSCNKCSRKCHLMFEGTPEEARNMGGDIYCPFDRHDVDISEWS